MKLRSLKITVDQRLKKMCECVHQQNMFYENITAFLHFQVGLHRLFMFNPRCDTEGL
jgi:hypothetical protein